MHKMVFFFLVYASIWRAGFQGKGFVLLQAGMDESKEKRDRKGEREGEKRKRKIGNNTEHVLTKMMLRLDCYVIFVFRRVGDW